MSLLSPLSCTRAAIKYKQTLASSMECKEAISLLGVCIQVNLSWKYTPKISFKKKPSQPASSAAWFKPCCRRRTYSSQSLCAVGRDLPVIHRSWGQLLLWHGLNNASREARAVPYCFFFLTSIFLLGSIGHENNWNFWDTIPEILTIWRVQ